MKGITIVILVASLVGLLFSCSLQQKNNYHCKRCPTRDTDTLIVKETVTIHDTILVTQDRELVIHDTVPCDDFEISKDSNGVRVKVVVKNRYITVKADCEGQMIRFRWVEKNKWIYERHDKLATIVEKTKAGRFYVWFFWIVVVAVALRITFWILKKTGTFPISIKRSG